LVTPASYTRRVKLSSGPLNLSDADTRGFEAFEAGRYNAEVFEMKMDAVKNTSGQGKMPAGTPMIKVQFKITDEDLKEKLGYEPRVFAQYIIPPKDYDKGKAAKIKGMMVRFFVALGTSEDQVKSAKFDPDFEDYIGRGCVVVVGKEPKKNAQGEVIEGEYNNPVKGVKPAGSASGSSGSGLL
jgi:hypothetical protein